MRNFPSVAMIWSARDCVDAPGWWKRPGITGVVLLALLGAGIAEGRPTGDGSPSRTSERKRITVKTLPLSYFTEDSLRLLPELRWESLPTGTSGAAHAISFLEGDDSGGVTAQLQTLLDLAGNYGYFAEYQFAPASFGRVGVIVSPRFPLMTFHWEVHPYESVPSEEGLWRAPFADTGDVMAVTSGDGQALIQLDAAAAARIDASARTQGHRRYRIRIEGPEGARISPPCTWIPGLSRVPWPAALGTQPELEWNGLQGAFAARRAARLQTATALGLGEDVSWSATTAVPRYSESVYLWLVPGVGEPVGSPYYAPGVAAENDQETWVPLAGGEWSDTVVPLPASWRVEGAAIVSDSEASLALKDDGNGPPADAFAAYLRRHRTREAALLLEGRVLGVVPVADLAEGRCLLATLPHERNSAILQRWEEARGPSKTPSEAAVPADAPMDVPTDGELDFFQVRLMAEPQDRELIPVTHFRAPGANRGVVVAVQNDIILDSSAVTGARLEREADRLYLHLSLTEAGRDALADACFTHLGKQLAIVFEDELISAPTIVDWELEELTFKGTGSQWPDMAQTLMARLGNS